MAGSHEYLNQQLLEQLAAQQAQQQAQSDATHGQRLYSQPPGGPPTSYPPYGQPSQGSTLNFSQAQGPTHIVGSGSTGGRQYSPNPFNSNQQPIGGPPPPGFTQGRPPGTPPPGKSPGMMMGGTPQAVPQAAPQQMVTPQQKQMMMAQRLRMR